MKVQIPSFEIDLEIQANTMADGKIHAILKWKDEMKEDGRYLTLLDLFGRNIEKVLALAVAKHLGIESVKSYGSGSGLGLSVPTNFMFTVKKE